MFGFGSKTIVGLDVGSSSIKAVELKRKGRDLEVAHLGLEPLAPDIVVDSMIVDSGTVSSAISKLFTDCAIKTRNVATAVSGHSGIVKKNSYAVFCLKKKNTQHSHWLVHRESNAADRQLLHRA